MSEFIPLLFLMALSFLVGILLGAGFVHQEAFERGHMVECLGKVGYYWECE